MYFPELRDTKYPRIYHLAHEELLNKGLIPNRIFHFYSRLSKGMVTVICNTAANLYLNQAISLDLKGKQFKQTHFLFKDFINAQNEAQVLLERGSISVHWFMWPKQLTPAQQFFAHHQRG